MYEISNNNDNDNKSNNNEYNDNNDKIVISKITNEFDISCNKIKSGISSNNNNKQL